MAGRIVAIYSDGAIANSSAVPPVSATYALHDRAFVLAIWSSSGGTSCTAITDGTNTYTAMVSPGNSPTFDTSGPQAYQWYECLDCAAGTFSVTGTLSSTPGYRGCIVVRCDGVSNAAAAQAFSSLVSANVATTTDAIGSGNATPTSQPAFILGACVEAGGSSVSAGTGFTDGGTATTFNAAFGNSSRFEYKSVASTAAVAATFTGSSATNNPTAFVIVVTDGGGAAAATKQLLTLGVG